MYIYIYGYLYLYIYCRCTEYREAKTRRMPYVGRAAARRTAPMLLRAIRVGRDEGEKNLGIYLGIYHYGVTTVSRLLKIIGVFCRISSLL